ncbi:BamA/TamA family outer membrane protein [Algoriphagus halophytocola]|uniref:BamA/TamA family outer membrane protein n=1 Tax=Algoriphagus halophytocola TaxID=2991499 RepID=UPI0022DD28CD|nr:BamA/TamA family outer membrane protein [Algoriphagus sp. TR-M9]WBL44292.1 BamA/TamA family outer membrane protein [Algoriphagus sp. TR-M9]
MKRICIIFLWISTSFQALAQDADTVEYLPNRINNFSILPLPAIAYNPANGWMFGVAAASSWYMGAPSTTHQSNLVFNFLYTTKKQWIISSKSNVFLADDQWNLIGDWRYFITSQPTFGLGSSSPNELSMGLIGSDPVLEGEQQMDFSLIKFYETILRRVGTSKFYIGLGYHLDIHQKIESYTGETLDFEADFSHDFYNEQFGFPTDKYTLSGVSLNGIMENRDIAVSPYERNYAMISYKINPEFLGSNQSSSTLLLDYRHYFTLNPRRKRHVLAAWVYGNFLISGDLPYMNLPALGWDMFGRTGRGYAQGRFRGEQMAYTELEYRFPLQKNKDLFGGTVFVNAASFSSKLDGEKLMNTINPGYGLGLRVMINKEKRTTITADYGFGQQGNSGFYLNINESF